VSKVALDLSVAMIRDTR